MNRNILLSAIGLIAFGSAAVIAAPAPQQPMSFFVTSTVPGSGNLGGLAGADAICQNLAADAGAGNRTWRAYLSQERQQGTDTQAINARQRIGAGPWYNANGVLIARNNADLHGDQQRDRNNIKKSTALDERGNMVNGVGDMPNQHDILTGSDSHGRAWIDGLDHTCNNWTSGSNMNRATVGHHDNNGGPNTSWNSAHMSRTCTATDLAATGGAGKFYCFAIN